MISYNRTYTMYDAPPAYDAIWDLARYDGDAGPMCVTSAADHGGSAGCKQQPGSAYTSPAAAAAAAACNRLAEPVTNVMQQCTAAAATAACNQVPGACVTMTEEDWAIFEQLESEFRGHSSITNISSSITNTGGSAWEEQQPPPEAGGAGGISPGTWTTYDCNSAAAAAAAAEVHTSMPASYEAAAANALSPFTWQQQKQKQPQQQHALLDQVDFTMNSSMSTANYSAASTAAATIAAAGKELDIAAAAAAAAAAPHPNSSGNSDHTADGFNARGSCSSLHGSRSSGNVTVAAAAVPTAAGGGRSCGATAAAAAAVGVKRSSRSCGFPQGKSQRISRARHEQELTSLIQQVERLTDDNQRLQQRTATLLSAEQDMLKRVASLTKNWWASVAANEELQRENIALRQQLSDMQQQQWQQQ